MLAGGDAVKQVLLGNAPLGQGGAVASKDRFGNPPYFLVKDAFTTNRAGGAVNGTLAEPGPGLRQVTDGSNTESISGGRLVVTSSAGARDPEHLYSCSYRVGRLLVAEITPGGTGNQVRIGFGWTGSTTLLGGLRVATGGNFAPSRSPGTGPNVASYSSATSYQIAVVLGSVAGYFFVKGGAYSNWTLLWTEPYTIDASTFRCGMQAIAAAQSYTSDFLRVPATCWLPVPVASDGFSSWGTTDGLAHGDTTGLGAGGNGLTWTTVGTWAAFGGVAGASALSSGSAIAYVNSGKADALVTAVVNRSIGDAGLLLRFADGNNFISCRHDGSNVLLIKKVAGVNTTVQSTATTYVSGAKLRVIAVGSAFRVFYNDLLVGSEQTISDAALQSPTNHGLYTTSTANSFDDFVVRPRGSGGEYAALDNF